MKLVSLLDCRRTTQKSKFSSSKQVSTSTNLKSIYPSCSPDSRNSDFMTKVKTKAKKSFFSQRTFKYSFEEEITPFKSKSNENPEQLPSPQDNNKSLMLGFLRAKLGEITFLKISEKIEMEEHPASLIKSMWLRELCGSSYQKVARILSQIYFPKVSPSSNASDSTKLNLSEFDIESPK